jgi:hypothetical protein
MEDSGHLVGARNGGAAASRDHAANAAPLSVAASEPVTASGLSEGTQRGSERRSGPGGGHWPLPSRAGCASAELRGAARVRGWSLPHSTLSRLSAPLSRVQLSVGKCQSRLLSETADVAVKFRLSLSRVAGRRWSNRRLDGSGGTAYPAVPCRGDETAAAGPRDQHDRALFKLRADRWPLRSERQRRAPKVGALPRTGVRRNSARPARGRGSRTPRFARSIRAAPALDSLLCGSKPMLCVQPDCSDAVGREVRHGFTVQSDAPPPRTRLQAA